MQSDPPRPYSRTGALMRQWRAETGTWPGRAEEMTQDEAGRLLGWSQNGISLSEGGVRSVPSYVAVEVSRVYRRSPEDHALLARTIADEERAQADEAARKRAERAAEAS